MKRPEYVAAVTGVYARLLEENRKPTAEERDILERAFSRSGFTDGYWRGRRGPDLFGFRPEDAAPAPPSALPKAGRRVPVAFTALVRAGVPCSLSLDDGRGNRVAVTGPVPEPAGSRPLTLADLTARLEKTGGTPYLCVMDENSRVDPGLYLSAAAVNALRRDALDALSAARAAAPPRRECFPPPPLPEAGCSADTPRFTVSVTTAAQLSGELLALHPARVLVPLEVLAALSALPEGETEWCAILPRVWRDRDEPQLKTWLDHAKSLGVTGAMAGNIGHLPLLCDSSLYIYGDYGLNVFNSRSLDYLRKKGLRSACVSFELRFSQIRDLRKLLPAEALVYGHLPLMITENCLIRNSGPCRCDRPNVLRDRTGAAFPLLPAYGHRTEIQNDRPLWLADLPDYRRLGLRYARLRFTTESPGECVQVFRDYLEGRPARGEFTRGLCKRGVE